MINLTWAQIRDPEFNPIMERILNSKMPFPSARRILGVMKDIREEQKISDEMWARLCDELWEPVPERPEIMKIKPGVDPKLAHERVNEFLRTVVEIHKERITNDELQTFDITPVQLLKLEGLIAED